MVSQAAAFRDMVDGLTIGPEYAALIAYCSGLAEMIDEYPERSTLWREYRPALERLLLASEDDDGEASVLELMHSSLGDAEDAKPAKRRTGGGGGSRSARPSVDAVATTDRGRRSRAS